ncbi:MAG: beta-ketoacyl-[acyl-carrier-protein] synthase family protein [Deltaproteobacteria bacterium]|nr:beta-ketoacyl-[acyl-carrier-protein] synthase family protein [Deltaproteobacteria bacterium]
MKRRVLITGVGVVSPVGIGKQAFWRALISGNCGIGPVRLFDASSYPCRIAAEVKKFDPADYMSPKEARRSSRSTQFSLIASQLALKDAGLPPGAGDPHRTGIVFGTALGPMDVIEKFCSLFYERGLRRVNPFFLGMINKNSTIGALAGRFGMKGYNLSIASGCSSGNVAIAAAFQAVASGLADVMLTGGVDTPISPSIFGLYAASRSLYSLEGDPRQSMRPYDKRREGFVLGEGAGALILETWEHARRRGPRAYAEILSASLTNDAENPVVFSPSDREMTRAFVQALKEAGLGPADIDYICSHAHSSLLLDRKETRIIKKVFGARAYQLPVSSIKATVGHSMAGGTAMQSIAACLALQKKILPPTLNYEVPDPECDLDYVPKTARRKEIQVALVDSFGLGGTNVVIILRCP